MSICSNLWVLFIIISYVDLVLMSYVCSLGSALAEGSIIVNFLFFLADFFWGGGGEGGGLSFSVRKIQLAPKVEIDFNMFLFLKSNQILKQVQ